eukprot:217147-Rhodomonas_salina.1
MIADLWYGATRSWYRTTATTTTSSYAASRSLPACAADTLPAYVPDIALSDMPPICPSCPRHPICLRPRYTLSAYATVALSAYPYMPYLLRPRYARRGTDA